MIVDGFAGFCVGLLIWYIRDNERAPVICAVAAATVGWFRVKMRFSGK